MLMKKLAAEFRQVWKYRELLVNLVIRNIKVRYKRSALGFLWAMLNPMLMMTVMYVAFQKVFKPALPHYAAYLITGLIGWNLFIQSTHDAMYAFTSNSSLLRKVFLPKAVFPVANVMSGLVNFFLSLLPLYIIFFLSGAYPSMRVVLLPACLLEMLLFTIGLSLMIATIVVFFHDASYIYEVLTLALMYITPIFYPVSILPARVMKFMYFNPLYHYLTLLRGIFFDNSITFQELQVHMLWGGAFAVAAFMLGAWIYLYNKNNIIFFL